MTDGARRDGGARGAREVLIAGLRDAHAVERQAVAVLEMQAGRLRDYPAFADRVARHADESRVHARRLQTALRSLGAAPSMLRDVGLSALGFAQSTAQSLAGDAPIKAMLADTMFEHLEIAAYRSLLELADLAGAPELKPDLAASLREEEAMARWLEDNLVAVVRAYVMLGAGAGGSAATSQPAHAGLGSADAVTIDPVGPKAQPSDIAPSRNPDRGRKGWSEEQP